MAKGKRQARVADLPGATQARLLRQKMALTVLQCAMILIALSAVIATYLSRAWFANNRTAAAQGATVSVRVDPSLYVSQSSPGGGFQSSLGWDWSGAASKLYPISTPDLTQWWYVSEWQSQAGTVNGSTVHRKVPGSYAAASPAEQSGSATYLNSLEEADRLAYYYADFYLYTSSGSLEVYLDPVSPLAVTGTTENGTDLTGDLVHAVRVGLAVWNGSAWVPKGIHDPDDTALDGTDGSYTAVTGTTSTGAVSSSYTNLTRYRAGKSGESYTAGAASLGTANTEGLKVRVYLWLEGTDPLAVLGHAEGRTGLGASLGFVGVETTS